MFPLLTVTKAIDLFVIASKSLMLSLPVYDVFIDKTGVKFVVKYGADITVNAPGGNVVEICSDHSITVKRQSSGARCKTFQRKARNGLLRIVKRSSIVRSSWADRLKILQSSCVNAIPRAAWRLKPKNEARVVEAVVT
jgi:hypothetical protein